MVNQGEANVRCLLADGKPIRRSQLREARRDGRKIWMGYSPDATPQTGQKPPKTEKLTIETRQQLRKPTGNHTKS
jgi:hypothetical protein